MSHFEEEEEQDNNISHDQAESEIVYETDSQEEESLRDPSEVNTQSGAGSPRKYVSGNEHGGTDSKYEVPDEEESSTPDRSLRVIDMSEIRKSQENGLEKSYDEGHSQSHHMYPSPSKGGFTPKSKASPKKDYNEQEKSHIVDYLLQGMKSD